MPMEFFSQNISPKATVAHECKGERKDLCYIKPVRRCNGDKKHCCFHWELHYKLNLGLKQRQSQLLELYFFILTHFSED